MNCELRIESWFIIRNSQSSCIPQRLTNNNAKKATPIPITLLLARFSRQITLAKIAVNMTLAQLNTGNTMMPARCFIETNSNHDPIMFANPIIKPSRTCIMSIRDLIIRLAARDIKDEVENKMKRYIAR